MDLVVAQHNVGAPLSIAFWEAKCADNPVLRASEDNAPKVLEQVGKYVRWMMEDGRVGQVQQACRTTAATLTALYRHFRETGGEPECAGLWQALARQETPSVMIQPGIVIGTDKPVISEAELEEAFVELARKTPRHVFVQWSAQNIDHTVTLFRAAKRTDRNLVVDLYGADVLRRIAEGTRLPVPGADFPELKVLITPGGKRLYARQGREDFVTEMAASPFATSRTRLIEDRAIIMLRDTMVRDFDRAGLGFTPADAYAFSNWSGYLDPDNASSGWARARAAGAATVKLHTSGHASPSDLSRFATAIAPKALVPVHGIAWDEAAITLPPVRRLADGEPWQIP